MNRSARTKGRRIAISVTLLFTALASLALAAPAQAQAGNTVYRTKGLVASAGFRVTDPSDPCITWDVILYASRSSYGPAEPHAVPAIFVTALENNNCTFEQRIWGAGGLLGEDQFVINAQLRSASLDATLTFCEWNSGECASGEVEISWTGTGDLLRGDPLVRHLEFEDGCTVQEFLAAAVREAIITGTLSIGGEPIISGAALYGGLSSSKALTVNINCF